MKWYLSLKLFEQVLAYGMFGMIILILALILIAAAFEGWRDEYRRKQRQKGAGK